MRERGRTGSGSEEPREPGWPMGVTTRTPSRGAASPPRFANGLTSNAPEERTPLEWIAWSGSRADLRPDGPSIVTGVPVARRQGAESGDCDADYGTGARG